MGWELLFMQGSPFLFSSLPQLGWILISFIFWLDIFLIFSDNFISQCLEIPPHIISTELVQGGEGAGGERARLLPLLGLPCPGQPSAPAPVVLC